MSQLHALPETRTSEAATNAAAATTAAPAISPAPVATATGGERPRLADGIELIGEYEDSGFKEAPSLARRADGQVIQLSRMLYAVAQQADGSRTIDEIAAAAGEAVGRHLSAANVEFLVTRKLRPLGVLAGADGRSPELKRNDPMTALRFRAALVPDGVVHTITTLFRPLYFPVVVLAVLAALAGVDAYVFFVHGLAQGVRGLLTQPAYLMVMFGMVVASAAFHECGHATACRYGGAKPGVMGAGLYFVWPAFYTDVTDAYRLGKGGRLRTDLGGIYFNIIFSVGTFAAYLLTHAEPLLVIIALQHLEMAHQFLPSLRLDGYYVVADLTGVPDLFGRIKPVLRSVLPGHAADPRVTELKTWVRAAVTLWVFITVPAIILLYGLLLINIPRMFATAWSSAQHLVGAAAGEFAHGRVLPGVFDWIQVALLVLPIVGLVLTLATTGRQLAGRAWQRTEGHPVARGGLALAGLGAAALLLVILGPRGNYHPIRPTDRGTLAAGASELVAAPADVASGQTIGDAPAGDGTAAPAAGPPAGSSNPAPGTAPATANPQAAPAAGGSDAPPSGPQPAAAPIASPASSPAPSPVASPRPSPASSPAASPSP